MAVTAETEPAPVTSSAAAWSGTSAADLAFQNRHQVAAYRLAAFGGDVYQAFHLAPRVSTSRRSLVTINQTAQGDPTPPVPMRLDAFLLAGQFPGTSHALALHRALTSALAHTEANSPASTPRPALPAWSEAQSHGNSCI